VSAPLPVIVGLPHGGLAAPGEMAGRIAITDTTIYNECDLWVHDLYDFAHPDLTVANTVANGGRPGPGVLATVEVPVGRVFVDANRQLDDTGFDGAIKTGTSYGDPVYQDLLTTSDRQRSICGACGRGPLLS
jgi:N-formylglutamate amidohydrolase